jgi:MscS family membrane protein
MNLGWLQEHWWQIACLASMLALAAAASWALRRVLASRVERLRACGAPILRTQVARTLVPLLCWGLFLGGCALAVHFLDLPPSFERWLNRLLQSALTLLVAFVAAAAAAAGLEHWAKQCRDPAEAQTRATLAPVLARASRVFLVIIAALLVLQNIGYNVAGLLAGLGIGGLAVALAAKETLANLFGSIALLMDRTFEVGDTIKQADVEGVVVKIGLRSTRVRTKEGYIVSIPNQLITNAPVTNMTPGKGGDRIDSGT